MTRRLSTDLRRRRRCFFFRASGFGIVKVKMGAGECTYYVVHIHVRTLLNMGCELRSAACHIMSGGGGHAHSRTQPIELSQVERVNELKSTPVPHRHHVNVWMDTCTGTNVDLVFRTPAHEECIGAVDLVPPCRSIST